MSEVKAKEISYTRLYVSSPSIFILGFCIPNNSGSNFKHTLTMKVLSKNGEGL
jgi:hypothetical protein